MRLHVQRLNNLPHHRPVQYTPPLSPYIYIYIYICCLCAFIHPLNVLPCMHVVVVSILHSKVYAMDVIGPIPPQLWTLTHLTNLYIYIWLYLFLVFFLLSFIFSIVIIEKEHNTHASFFLSGTWLKIFLRAPFPLQLEIWLEWNGCKAFYIDWNLSS